MSFFPPKGSQGLGAAQSGVESYYPILIRYIGDNPDGGTVTVAAGGDITLKTGPVATSTADVTTECPFSGGLGGVIDVSDDACSTLGEVVDAINASPNWVAVIQDGRRSDSSNNTLAALSETSAATPAGLALAGDGAVSLKSVIALVPFDRNDIRPYLNGAAAFSGLRAVNDGSGVTNPANFSLNPNPFDGQQTAVTAMAFDHTNGSAPFRNIYSVKPFNVRPATAPPAAAADLVSASTETVTTLYSINSEGSNDFSNNPILGKRGEKVLVEGVGGASYDTLVLLAASGYFFPVFSGRARQTSSR